MKIRKGDTIKVTTGKHKGHTGIVLGMVNSGQGVLVEGVNVKKKAVKKSEENSENYMYIQHPVHVPNVRLVDETGKYIKNRKEEVKKKQEEVKPEKGTGKTKKENRGKK